jgi:plasmid maintenance system killer protein
VAIISWIASRSLAMTERGHREDLNDRWRVCFVWRGGDAHDVEIVDYH